MAENGTAMEFQEITLPAILYRLYTYMTTKNGVAQGGIYRGG